ncbi:MAG: hypothetical protein AAF789_03435 [Bacteroidota bacterium]
MTLFFLRRVAAPLSFYLMVLLSTAQDEGFIYGTILTEDGDKYTGPIRWGKEEVYWTDLFNASKEENENLDLLSDEELASLKKRDGDSYEFSTSFFKISWNGGDDDFTHQFVTQFGNIRTIETRSGNDVKLILKDGTKLRLNGSGYNDIGSDIKIIDSELGQITLDWDNIEQIDFASTPSRLEEKFGDPLYGSVECDFGTFKGFVQWDHDERVGSDVLDGEEGDDDYEIKFGKIKSIRRRGYNRSEITLKSGRSITLEGSNDVNDDNKGIIVEVKGLGRVDIEWDEFEQVVFEEVKGSGPAYDDFNGPKLIEGKIKTRGDQTFAGQLIYDLDEAYTFELLNGINSDIKFFIPFRNINSIEPESSESSIIRLNSGKELELEDEQDVTRRNEGVIVKNGSNISYIPWKDIERIELN